MPPRLSLALFGLCQTGAHELRQLASHPGVAISWIVEKDTRFAEEMAQDLPPQFGTNIIKPSYAHLVYEDPNVDAVLVCSPYSGVNWVRRALSHGKGVFCEAPMMCRDIGAILACHEISEAIDKPLMFFLQSRFDTFTSKAREMTASGEIGKIESVKTTSSCSVPLSLCDTQTTDECILGSTLPGLDLVCWLTQEDPLTVHMQRSPPRSSADHAFHSVQVDLCFPSGTMATVEINRERAADEDQLEVCGTEGKILVSAGRSLHTHCYGDSGTHQEICRTSGDQHKSPLMTAIVHFIDVIRGSDTSKIPIMDVLRLSVVTSACEQSLRSDTLVMVAKNTLHRDNLLQMPVWKDRPDVY